MGSYFARNTLKWTLAPDNLDHWLDAGGLQEPGLFMDHTLIMDQEPVIGKLVDEHYDVIVDGIKKRLLAPPGVKFPASAATITGPFGDHRGQPGRKSAGRRRRGDTLLRQQRTHDR